jgi:hypothetical protein
MVQKFLVQIQDQPGTRWLADSQEMQDRLARFTWLILLSVTQGPIPHILVVHAEKPETDERFERRE